MGMPVEGSAAARLRDRVGLIIAWGAWLAMTAYLVLYVLAYSRDVPFMDDFDMVPVLTGTKPVSLEWAWSQHHEHRPLISRLILVGLSRFITGDFRAPRLLDVGLLSAMAATLLLLSRRLRGSARATDAVLPLAFLSLGQAESLLIGFAMNLVLTSAVAVGLIATACRGSDRAMWISFGFSVVLLPLCGGSGLVMLPPLWLWLGGYFATGWWSGRRPGVATRATGLGMLLASSAIVVLYLRGFSRPGYSPNAGSAASAAVGAIRYLSLAFYPTIPHPGPYWWPAALIAMVLLGSTLLLLARAALRAPEERAKAMALMAVILSMIGVAAALGVSRGGPYGHGTLLSRYVTLAVPLLGAVYVAWVAYGKARIRVGVHAVLLVLAVSTLPANDRFGRTYGRPVRIAADRVERGLINRASPTLFPDREYALSRLRMLQASREGAVRR